jgi:DNA-binding NarL/FixJ family response regulator
VLNLAARSRGKKIAKEGINPEAIGCILIRKSGARMQIPGDTWVQVADRRVYLSLAVGSAGHGVDFCLPETCAIGAAECFLERFPSKFDNRPLFLRVAPRGMVTEPIGSADAGTETRDISDPPEGSAKEELASARAIPPTARKVLLVEPHQMFRDALARVINEAGGFQVFADAETGSGALKICRRAAPEMVVLAIELEDEDGIMVTGEILRVRPETKVILMQNGCDEEVTLRGIRSGALGLVSTRASASYLIEALRAVAQGRSCIGPTAWDVVLRRLVKTREKSQAGGLESLSPRQRQILALIAEGRTTKEIAAAVGVTVETIHSQQQALMRKLGVKNIVGAIRVALANRFKAGSQ